MRALSGKPGRRLTSLQLATIIYRLKPDAEGVVVVSPAQAGAVRRAIADLRRAGEVFSLGREHENGTKRGLPRIEWASKGTARIKWGNRDTARAYAEMMLATFGPKHIAPELLKLVVMDDVTSPSDGHERAAPSRQRTV
ncbi:MAG TPA: hypothetical protein VHL98_21280 [Microvirga sp.]|nr:hypothetical protein [Microvirga sp.]